MSDVKTNLMHVSIQLDNEGAILAMSSNSTLKITDPSGGDPFTKPQNLSCVQEHMTEADRKAALTAVKNLAIIVLRSQPPTE